ncbi:MAG: nucleotide excision repair endonuclease [Verrucomicrobiales bacterium]|nr:nucleotide excision repair endonuclease [Verrucomicrobiales bacterium]
MTEPAVQELPPRVRQLRLLPWPRPLEERLGRAFFPGLPRGPGVYLMWDEADRLIYVGKAVNLRQRLGSYRYLEGASRKTRRLVHTVRRITFEECASAEAAVVRENELLRQHRPRFNRLNTWPQANCYLELSAGRNWIGLAVTRPEDGDSPLPAPERHRELPGLAADTMEPAAEAPCWEQSFGAFRPGAIAAFHCLAGILGAALDPPPGGQFARGAARAAPPRRVRLRCADPSLWVDQLTLFLSGETDVLLDRIEAGLPGPASAFESVLRADRIERLRHFFRTGPARNRHLRRTFGIAPRRLEREELDDLLARDRERRVRPAGG